MAITKLGAPDDNTTGDIVRLLVDFKEIIIAETDTVEVPEPVNASRQTKREGGVKSKVEASAKETEKVESLKSGIVAITQFFTGT